MSQFGPVRLFIFKKCQPVHLFGPGRLIYFLKSVDPMRLFGGGLLFKTQEYFHMGCA